MSVLFHLRVPTFALHPQVHRHHLTFLNLLRVSVSRGRLLPQKGEGMDTASAMTERAVRHGIRIATRWVRGPLDTCQPPTATREWHFYSTVLPSRTRRNSVKTNDGASFYPSQKPKGAILTGLLDNAESVHIRYLFALWLQERTARVSFTDHASGFRSQFSSN